MISVLIPVYRYDVRPLVHDLVAQTADLKADVEILVYDDASPPRENWGRAELRLLPGITYLELKDNHGRAAIRNRLVRAARHPYVVLLDADGQIPPDFIANYLEAIRNWRNTDRGAELDVVIVGGRVYAKNLPAHQDYRLHWSYGKERESRSLARRKREGWFGFQSNNFVATRSLLLRYPFPTDQVGYGHEDTLWGQLLAGKGIGLVHIHNPVVHLGLETAEVFLTKQREAIRNLRALRAENPNLRTRLTDLADRYRRLVRLAKLAPEATLIRRLTKPRKPNLFWLDLLKLKWYLSPPE